MAHTIDLLISTILSRPYVFAFLALYLLAASLKVGTRKAVYFTLTAWIIAYVSEFSSVRIGVPFGLYHYIPSTLDKELWLAGVPFMDSLSFTFLAYCGWTMARVFLSPSYGGLFAFTIKEDHLGRNRFSPSVIALGALFFMLLDVVIDPLALRGDKWFLGKIYYYPEPGAYFGVTIANFVGWYIVGLVTLAIWGVIDHNVKTPRTASNAPLVDLFGPVLYYIVLLFNLVMTFWIGEYGIGWAGVFIFLPITIFFLMRLSGRR